MTRISGEYQCKGGKRNDVGIFELDPKQIGSDEIVGPLLVWEGPSSIPVRYVSTFVMEGFIEVLIILPVHIQPLHQGIGFFLWKLMDCYVHSLTPPTPPP